MRDILTALRERAAAGEGPAFCHFRHRGAEQTFSCADALERSARYANLFKDAGLGDGDSIAIILQHAPDLYFAFLGALLCGCTPSFMAFPSSKQDRDAYWTQHQALFARTGVLAVVTYPDNVEALNTHCPGVRVFTPSNAQAYPAAHTVREVRGGDVAFIQYSSGTTGLKKGVCLSYGAVARQLERYAEALALTADDVIVSWLPLYHDMGLIACFMLPLTLGIPIVSLDPFEWVARPELLFKAIHERGGTHVWLPNFAFSHLARTVPEDLDVDLSGVKAFIDCSEPCLAETFALFAGRFAGLGVRRDQLSVCYAMAEAVFAVTQTRPGAPVEAIEVDEAELFAGRIAPVAEGGRTRQLLPVGRPVRDVELEVRDEAGVALAEGAIGEVVIRAPFLFTGYHRQPELTAQKLRDGWYHTGDVGFALDGELYLLGRMDDLLIVNGRNIYAHHVELAVNEGIPEINGGRCVALGVLNPQVGSQELIVVAELSPGCEGPANAVAKKVKLAVMNGFGVVPREVRFVPAGWLVKTTSGKLSREKNLVKYLELEHDR